MEPPAASPDFRRPPYLLIAFGLVALTVAGYWTTLGWLSGRWRTDPFYSHGPLVPAVSIFLLWRSRRSLLLRPRWSPIGIPLLASAAILHALGLRLSFEFLSSTSILVLLCGLAHLAGGRRLFRVVAFPILYLFFAIPLPILVLQQVSLPLQLFSSACAGKILHGMGCAVYQQGVMLVFPGFTLAIADACSGLRSLITVLAISTLAAHLALGSPLRKFLIIAFGGVAALVANITRILLAGLVGLAYDGATASVLFERYSGYYFFALVALLMLAAFKIFSDDPRPVTTPMAPPTQEPLAPRVLALRVLAPAAAAVLLPWLVAATLGVGRSREAPSLLASWDPVVPGWATMSVRHPPAFTGEEWVTGSMKDAGGRTVGFTVLHSTGGRYLHSPEACSIAAGWIPERQEFREVRSEGVSLPLHFWVLRRERDRVALVFWFDLDGIPRRGSFDQHLGAVWQRFKAGRIDSAYGEVVAPLESGRETADEAPLLQLADALHREVRARLWPR